MAIKKIPEQIDINDFLACAAYRYVLWFPRRTVLKSLAFSVDISYDCILLTTQGKSKLSFTLLSRTLNHIGGSHQEYGYILDRMHVFNNALKTTKEPIMRSDVTSVMKTFIWQYIQYCNNSV